MCVVSKDWNETKRERDKHRLKQKEEKDNSQGGGQLSFNSPSHI
jgi:hypothetical protein